METDRETLRQILDNQAEIMQALSKLLIRGRGEEDRDAWASATKLNQLTADTHELRARQYPALAPVKPI